MQRILLTAAIWVIFVASAVAQTIQVMPTGGRFAGYASIPAETTAVGKWLIFADGYLQVQGTKVDGGKGIVWQGPAGKYGVIYVPLNDAEPIITEVVLGGDNPVPPIPPVPPVPPPPPPNQKWQIMLFYNGDQLDNLPSSQRSLLTSLALRKKLIEAGHSVLEVLEAAAIESVTDSRYQPWINKVKGDPLPRIAIAPTAGGEIQDFPLPADEAALWSLLANPTREVRP